jgi:error-prone DNA polymerase
MTSLERMVNVNNIDDLIAIVSVIRPGAANTMRKVNFARRAQGLDPVEYAHPCLEPVLRSTYGVVAYEEHVLQICEVFAGIAAGRADLLRRALVKNKAESAMRFKAEFVEAARRFGRTEEEITRVWELLYGFMGYAFCRAHSTAYGVEAYEAAYLKRYYPAEFLACVLTHGKGFYNKLVYSIECRRLGIGFVPPDVNGGNEAEFEVLYSEGDMGLQASHIRPPLRQIKGLSDGMLERAARGRPFRSLRDFVARVRPSKDEMENLIRAGAFDGFGKPRTAQFWEYLELVQSTSTREPGLFDALKAVGKAATTTVGTAPDGMEEPSTLERLRSEMELLGFTVSGHPLDMFPGVRWETYCPIADLGKYARQRVTVCGLIIEDRLHRQADGRPMKFISICDYSGILECELFASAYKRFGILTVRHPVVEIEGTVQPFDNGNGHTLQVHAVRKMRQRAAAQRGTK